MTATALVSFWAFSLMFVLTPGADWAYAMGAGIRGRHVIPAVLGLLVGYIVLTVIVAAGVGFLIAGNPLLMAILTVGGALYLIYLGIRMFMQPPTPAVDNLAPRNKSGYRVVLQGALVSGLNPKALMFFIAFLPPFTMASGGWSMPVQLFILGMVHTLSCSVVYLGVAIGAGVLLSARPAAALLIGRLSGGVVLVLGIFLLYRQMIAN